MNAGTISEQRKLQSTITPSPTKTPATITTTAVEIVDKQPELDKGAVLDTTKKPEAPKAPEHLQDSNCTYCKADAIASLSFRFSLVLVLLAFSYHLLKRPK